MNLLERYKHCMDIKDQLFQLEELTIEEYVGKRYYIDGEEYRVNIIDLSGMRYGYPCVQLQSIKHVSSGCVKGIEMTIEGFYECLCINTEV